MCTNIEITAKNGEHFWGRTMDLALPMFGEDPEHDLSPWNDYNDSSWR